MNIKRLELHIMPLTFADYTPRLRLGLEYIQNDKLGYDLEFGFGNYSINKSRLEGMVWTNEYSFFEVRPEVKYYFYRSGNDLAFYLATELFYINMSDIFEDDYYHLQNSSLIVNYDQAIFNKQKFGIHLKGGLQAILLNRLDIDFYCGIGVAYRIISYKDIINPITEEGEIFYEWILPRHKFEGNSTMFHITLGCKIGFILWKK